VHVEVVQGLLVVERLGERVLLGGSEILGQLLVGDAGVVGLGLGLSGRSEV
jgi:hypothetical protein